MQYVITLVHGTYPLEWLREWFRGRPEGGIPRAVWVREGSPIRRSLETLPGPIEVRHLRWSGRNSQRARTEAATRLSRDLTDLLCKYRAAKHFVIAHSHGGNVAMYALRDGDLATRITGLVCLATPFLCVSRPHMYEKGTTIWWSGWVEKKTSATIAACELPPLAPEKLMIVRAIGDEASLLLASGQFFSWLGARLSDFLGFSNKIADLIVSPGRWKWYVWVYALCLGVILPLGFYTIYSITVAPSDQREFENIPSSLTYLFWAIASPLLVGGFGAMLVYPVQLLRRLAIWLPFGPELAIWCKHLDVSVEVTPPGQWAIHELSPAADLPSEESTFFASRSSHSYVHQDPRALELLTSWIRARSSSTGQT